MKTIREWLNEFPVEIRDRAIRNAEASDWNAMDNHEQDTAHALEGAFNWHDTPEKDEFWNAWYTWLQDPSQPKPTIQPADGSVVVGNHSFEATEKVEPGDKTVREWLNELPDEIRDRAIKNAEVGGWNALELSSKNEAGALDGAFDWSSTPEKYRFWSEWKKWLIHGGPKPLIQPAYACPAAAADHSGDVNEKIERMRFEAASMYMAALATQPASPAHKAELSVDAADALIAELKKPKP
jgi:hypothetical protein